MNRHAEEYGNDWYVYAGKFCEIEGMEDHMPTKHVPISGSVEFIKSALAYNADVIEYRKLKGEQQQMEEDREQIQKQIEAEEKKRQELPKVDVPVNFSPIKKPSPAYPKKKEFPAEALAAHARLEKIKTKQRLLKNELDNANNRYCSIEGFEPPESWINMIGLRTSAQKEHAQRLEEARKPITQYVAQLKVLEKQSSTVKCSLAYSSYREIEKFNDKVDEEIKRMNVKAAARLQAQTQSSYTVSDDDYSTGLHTRG